MLGQNETRVRLTAYYGLSSEAGWAMISAAAQKKDRPKSDQTFWQRLWQNIFG